MISIILKIYNLNFFHIREVYYPSKYYLSIRYNTYSILEIAEYFYY